MLALYDRGSLARCNESGPEIAQSSLANWMPIPLRRSELVFMKSPQTESASTDVPITTRSMSSRIGGWLIGIILGLLLVVYITSFFLDGIIRPRIEANMNSGLKGYHVTLGHAHLQLIGLRLTLSRLVVVQEAHPAPAIAEFPLIRF